MIRTSILAVAAAAALAGAAGAADTAAYRETIDVSHVDFANPAQVETLYGRINAAATRICHRIYLHEPVDFAIEMPRDEAMAKCVDDAVRKAVADAHRPALAREWAMRGTEPATRPAKHTA